MRNLTSNARFSAKILWIASLAVLAAGLAIVPLRMAAQGPAPAAGSQPVSAAAQPAKTEVPKSEEEKQTEGFLLNGPLVKATAKALNLSLGTTANIYLFINFAIIVLAVGIPLVKFMPKVIRKRSQTLTHSIESARKVTDDANARLSAIEAKLSGLDEEIASIRVQVEQESAGDEGRIKASLKDESDRIVAAAEQEITVAAAQAKRGLRHFAADLAIEQAAKQLVLTPETDKALIAEFSADIAKGGQN